MGIRILIYRTDRMKVEQDTLETSSFKTRDIK